MNKIFNSKISIYFLITNGWLIFSFRFSFYSVWDIARMLPHAFISRSNAFFRTSYNFIGSVGILQHTAVIWHCQSNGGYKKTNMLDCLQLSSLFSVTGRRLFIFHCLYSTIVTFEQWQGINSFFFLELVRFN